MYRKAPQSASFTGRPVAKVGIRGIVCSDSAKGVLMINYSFDYLAGSARRPHLLEAKDDRDAYVQIAAFLKDNGGTLVPGTVRAVEYRKMPDPVETSLKPGEYDLAAAAQNGITLPGLSVLEG